MRVLAVLAVAVLSAQLFSSQARVAEELSENPIRRIVNLLQKMQTEVADEAKRDEELNEKFICYCEKNDGELSAGLQGLRDKIPQVEASIEEAQSLKQQLDAELVAHKDTRTNAKASIDSATKQREKEAGAFAEESGELSSNIAAIKKATDAIAKGMSGAFLQSGAANALRALVVDRQSMSTYARETLVAFLSASSGYAPAGGEILGILRQLQEDMEENLADITKTENEATVEFEGLVAAKEKEIAAATAAIEDKTVRAGETAVQIVGLQNDLADTKDELGADEAFLMELKKSCGTKAKEYAERKEMRAQEAVALSETIKILNDDDALDLFKKTLPTTSLLQLTRSSRELRAEAAALLRAAKGSPQLSLIAMALGGKKAGFEKVLKMIDDMVVKLKAEQVDDEQQQKWCSEEFDRTEDNTAASKRLVAGLEARIAEAKEGVMATTDEIATLKKGIKDLDAAVAEATEQRKEEHAAFVQTSAENGAAVQLLEVAKNRMNKFYNPALYKKPVRRELTEEERIYVNSGGADPRDAEDAANAGKGIAGTGVTVLAQAAPPPPPETAAAFTKKDSSGPLALIEKLKTDLEKDVQANEMEEQQAQKDYEEMMAESAAVRHADSKSLTEKDAQKADLEGELQAGTQARTNAQGELLALGEYMAQLHGSCDFLLGNFDARKEARASEVDALTKAKAVLSGADYSLLQTGAFMPRRA